jgi:hypothetical protein
MELLKTMTPQQGEKVCDFIANFYKCDFEKINRYLGLAYTSSSRFAGYWVCNVEEHFKNGYYIRCFAMSPDERVVIYCENENDEEMYFLV